jgi:hypothetical protein
MRAGLQQLLDFDTEDAEFPRSVKKLLQAKSQEVDVQSSTILPLTLRRNMS